MDKINVSFNEIESLSKRAAKGGGLSWGMAEDAGKATRWLTQYNIPGVDILCDILNQNDKNNMHSRKPVRINDLWQVEGDYLCPLRAGTLLCDQVNKIKMAQKMEFSSVWQPLMLIPFTSMAAKISQNIFNLSWDDMVLVIGAKNWQIVSGEVHSTARTTHKICCQPVEQAITEPFSRIARFHVKKNTWQDLEAYARRTLAPETEVSRLAGAGAGLTDND